MKELQHAKNFNDFVNDGKGYWYVETKENIISGIEKFEKGIYPMSAKTEVGGHRIILPNGETKFLSYSEIERYFVAN